MTAVQSCEKCFLVRPRRVKICPFCDAATWHPSDPTRNTWPEAAQADTRVDVRFACGDESLAGSPAHQWAWGDAKSMTITHWRFHK